MVAHRQSMLRTIPTLWLLMWSNIQPLVVATPPPSASEACTTSLASGSCSSSSEHGASLLQVQSRMGKIEAKNHRKYYYQSAKDKCVICTEIEKEVQEQVTKTVVTQMETATSKLEKEIMHQLLVRHNSTMDQLDKFVEDQISADLENEGKIQDLEDKLEKEFVENGVVTKLETRLSTIETRLATLEGQMKEVTETIDLINTDVADLRSRTSTFVNETKIKIKNMATLIKESTDKSETQVLKEVSLLIQKTSQTFSETILKKTEDRIATSVSETLVKVERIVSEAIDHEKEVHEEERSEMKEKLTKSWEKITTIVKELKTAIEGGNKATVENAQEIKSVKDSIRGVALAAAKKVVGEHAKNTATTINDLKGRLEDLDAFVEEEADAAMQRDEDIIELAKLMQESEQAMLEKTQEFIKKETDAVKNAISSDAAKKLELEIANVKSTSSEEAEAIEKVIAQMKKLNTTVSEEKELRLQNSKAISILREQETAIKVFIGDVKTEIKNHKESSHKKIMEQVKILMDDAQSSTIQKAKELSVKEMMTQITTVRTSVETKLETSITIIKESAKAEQENHEAESKKMQEKIAALKKIVSSNTEITSQLSADQKGLSDAVDALVDAVDDGDAKHAKAAEDIELLNEFIEKVAATAGDQRDKFPTKEEVSKLEAAVTQVNAKVVAIGDRLQKETEQREASILAIEDRVTANEEHLDEIEGTIIDTSQDIVDIATLLKEIDQEQANIESEAVKAALGAVKGMVEETTETVLQENMAKVKGEAEVMISQVQKTIQTLNKAVDAESALRQKADAKIEALKKKVVELSNSLDQKADKKSVDTITQTVTHIQNSIRKEKEVRSSSEKEMSMVKQAMVSLYRRTEKASKEVKHTKEVKVVHTVHHEHKIKSTERVTAIANKVKQTEAQVTADITKLTSLTTQVKSTLAQDEQARLKSDANLKILEEETMELFEKISKNDNNINALEEEIQSRIMSLSEMLNDISVTMQVSQESSSKDLARMDKMLHSLLTDLSAEQTARRQGDSEAEASIMARVRVLIEEMVAAHEKSVTESKSSSSSSSCKCNSVTDENGVTTKKCIKDGEEVASCGIEGWKPSIGSIPQIASDSGTGGLPIPSVSVTKSSSSSSKSSSTSTKCECKMEFDAVAGDMKRSCTKDGQAVDESACPMPEITDLDNLDSLFKDAKKVETSCDCEVTMKDDGTLGKVCYKNGEEVKESDCPNSEAQSLGEPDNMPSLEDMMAGGGGGGGNLADLMKADD
eukprot:gnl/MRDRNA2_/MRDRNA2_91207_c0_seq1.p1 gnl/MRDRNA2_/MRDRNA2_91207_c0~~gnl/MRDRNA2_/MRDRNA2_91207_c0_seq1.p1  ORF type:complete len:1299 (-),score=369.14 gnl/MRDRNA2_/MRDRNA2_91207_c0_seq1:44-3826(-)